MSDGSLFGQAKEYIRLGGRVVAIESAGGALTVTASDLTLGAGVTPVPVSVTGSGSAQVMLACSTAGAPISCTTGATSQNGSAWVGTLSLTANAGAAAGTYPLSIAATASGGFSGSKTIQVTVPATTASKSYVLSGGALRFSGALSLTRWTIDMRLHNLPLPWSGGFNYLVRGGSSGSQGISVLLYGGNNVQFQTNTDIFYCRPWVTGTDVVFRFQRHDTGYKLFWWYASNPSQLNEMTCSQWTYAYDPNAPTVFTNTEIGEPGVNGGALAYFRLYSGGPPSAGVPGDQSSSASELRWELNGNGQDSSGNGRHLSGVNPVGADANSANYIDTLPAIAGSGGGGGTGVSVTTTPSAVSINGGQAVSISSVVTGSANTAVTWTPTAGASGNNYSYTAPLNVHSTLTQAIRATSVADSTKFAESVVTVVPIGISVTDGTGNALPSTIGLQQTLSLRATLTGLQSGASPNVSWSGTGITPGTVTGNNVSWNWTSPASGSSASVTACSTQDSQRCTSVNFVMNSVPSLSVTPASSSLVTQTFTFTINRGDVYQLEGRFSTSSTSEVDINACRFLVTNSAPWKVRLYSTSGVLQEPGVTAGLFFPVQGTNCELQGDGVPALTVSQSGSQTVITVRVKGLQGMTSPPRWLWSTALSSSAGVIAAGNRPGWTPPLAFTMSMEPLSAPTFWPNRVVVFGAQQSAPTYINGSAAGSSWQVNGGTSYAPAQFIATPTICLSNVPGCLIYQVDYPDRSNRAFQAGNFTQYQTITLRATNMLSPSVFAERQAILDPNATPPPPPPGANGMGAEATPPATVNQVFNLMVFKEDSNPANLNNVSFTISKYTSVGNLELGAYCNVYANKVGSTWTVQVLHLNAANDPQPIGAPGEEPAGNGKCQIYGDQSTVTETATRRTFNFKVRISSAAYPLGGSGWQPGNMYVMTEPNGSVLHTFFLN